MPFVTTCVKKFSTTLRVLKSIDLDMVIVTWCHIIVICVRKFPTTEGFKKHRMRHGDSNDMSYDCNLCQNDFHHSQGFKKHCLRHGNCNEMLYDCDLCRNVSTNLRVLKKHRLIQGHHLLGSAQTHKSRKLWEVAGWTETI